MDEYLLFETTKPVAISDIYSDGSTHSVDNRSVCQSEKLAPAIFQDRIYGINDGLHHIVQQFERGAYLRDIPDRISVVVLGNVSRQITAQNGQDPLLGNFCDRSCDACRRPLPSGGDANFLRYTT